MGHVRAGVIALTRDKPTARLAGAAIGIPRRRPKIAVAGIAAADTQSRTTAKEKPNNENGDVS